MKRLIKKMVPEKIRWVILKYVKYYYKKSYSQSGEDMILNIILCNVKKGFYVDVGANNPLIASNTQFFYEKGWSGINIDAKPGSMRLFNWLRSRDINLEIPISDQEEILKYFMFSSSSFNTFVEELANRVIKNNGKKSLVGIKELQTKKLSQILDEYLKNREIDFLSVDVEGMDLQVLKSNNWNKYRPKVVVLEFEASQIQSFKENEIYHFLSNQDYTFYCFSPVNVFFVENGFYNIRFKNKR